MAAVGAGLSGLAGVSGVAGSWFLSSGVLMSILLLLLLSVLLTALCTDCKRRSFELRDSKVEKNPSALISVVKLEESMVAKENPMIDEIQNDEKDFIPEEKPVDFTPWRSHLRAPQHNQGNYSDFRQNKPFDWSNGSTAVIERTPADPNTTGESSAEEETPVPYMAWRSHLGPQWKQDPIYHTIEEPSQTNAPATSGHEQEQSGRESVAPSEAGFSESKPVYARVIKKEEREAPPPEVLQVEEEAEEVLSPPLPHRETEIDG